MKSEMKKISNYIIFQKLGEGATAEVHLAYDMKTMKYYAIKVFSIQKIKRMQMQDLIGTELNLLKSLSHKNIIKINDIITTVNNFYVILEYCNGKTLTHYKNSYYEQYKKPLPEIIIQKILRQLIQGLHFIHKNNCIHRDIKLDNILIDYDNITNCYVADKENHTIPFDRRYTVDEPFTIKIADLGFARILNERNLASTVCGTPINMAPDVFNWMENVDKPHSYNEKADLWSLGVMTYELLFGKPPFYDFDQHKLFRIIKEGKYYIPCDMTLSVEVISFINGLLQFSPENRMDWPQILSHPFITKEFNQLHMLDLKAIDVNLKEDNKGIVFNVKSKNEFEWLKPNYKANVDTKVIKTNDNEDNKIDIKLKEEVNTNKENEIVSIRRREEEERKIMEEKENQIRMKLIIEENALLKKTVDDLKQSLLNNSLSESENEELKNIIKIKTEENEKLIREIEALQEKLKGSVIIKDHYVDTLDSSFVNIATNENKSTGWEIISDTNSIASSSNNNNNNKPIKDTNRNEDKNTTTNLFTIINDFFK